MPSNPGVWDSNPPVPSAHLPHVAKILYVLTYEEWSQIFINIIPAKPMEKCVWSSTLSQWVITFWSLRITSVKSSRINQKAPSHCLKCYFYWAVQPLERPLLLFFLLYFLRPDWPPLTRFLFCLSFLFLQSLATMLLLDFNPFANLSQNFWPCGIFVSFSSLSLSLLFLSLLPSSSLINLRHQALFIHQSALIVLTSS